MVARRRRLTLRWSEGDPAGAASPTEIDISQSADVQKLDSYSQAIARAVNRVGKAIVSIQSGHPSKADPGIGLGSGIVISPRGVILTSSQVVHDSEELSVRFPDGTRLAAQKLAADPATDLALLAVQGNAFSHLPLGDSRKLHIGDTIMAVGNPRGHHSVISTGVVTTLGRSLRSRANWLLEGLIQHTAHISEGISGGALLDTQGNLIGVLTESIALGQKDHFAIPSRTAEWAVPQLHGRGEVRRGRIGVAGEEAPIPEEQARRHGVQQRTGIAVLGIEEGGPADLGGLKQGDWIISLNEQPCTNLEELHLFLAAWPLRRPLGMVVLRGDQKLQLEIEPSEYGI